MQQGPEGALGVVVVLSRPEEGAGNGGIVAHTVPAGTGTTFTCQTVCRRPVVSTPTALSIRFESSRNVTGLVQTSRYARNGSAPVGSTAWGKWGCAVKSIEPGAGGGGTGCGAGCGEFDISARAGS